MVLLAGGREAAQFPADSPEATLQAYLAAYEEGDLDAAHAYFSADVREQMDRRRTNRRWIRGVSMPSPIGPSCSTARPTPEIGSSSTSIVEEFYGDGLSGDTYRSPRDVRLVREDGEWRIDQALVWLDQAPIEPFQ